MPERSWSSQPFRAFPSSGAVAPLDALMPSCRSPTRRSERSKERLESLGGGHAARREVTRTPRLVRSRPFPRPARQVRLQGVAPRDESVANLWRLGLGLARCSPGFDDLSRRCTNAASRRHRRATSHEPLRENASPTARRQPARHWFHGGLTAPVPTPHPHSAEASPR
jgi:hypothetical protein